MIKHLKYILLLLLMATTMQAESLQPAVFARKSAMSTTYTSLNKAIEVAQEAMQATSRQKDTIVLVTSGLLDEDVTIPNGILVVIPYNDAYRAYTKNPPYYAEVDTSRYIRPTCFRQLTLAASRTITIAKGGILSVVGRQYYYVGGGQYATGSPQGPCGYMQLLDNATIQIQNGGILYAWGFIYGQGRVHVEANGIVYEMMQLNSWRGGGVSDAITKQPYCIYPFNSYYIQNIETTVIYDERAVEYVMMGLIADDVINTAQTRFIGSSAFLNIYDGTMTRTYDANYDRILYTVDGGIGIASIVIRNYKSIECVMAISNNISFLIKENSTMDVPYSMALLPGSTIEIEPNAVLTLGAWDNREHEMFVYDYENTWLNRGYAYLCDRHTPDYVATLDDKPQVPELTDATIIVNGTLESYSALYTTQGGARIVSSGEGEVIVHQIGNRTYTYQVPTGTITPEQVPITPAMLANQNGSFTPTNNPSAGGQFVCVKGTWYPKNQVPTDMTEEASKMAIPSARKYFYNGTLFIQKGNHFYSVLGR
ncbi:MAG: hypothetical protein KBS70_06060 [Bacteroidales bacterium]|nr:hypothetical protein [Candidatus Colicola equi]